MTTAIERAKHYSNAKLAALRTRLVGAVSPTDVVLTCGSYARREASDASDIDFFIVTQQPVQMSPAAGSASNALVTLVRDAINQIVPVEPAEDGAFSQAEARDALLRNIGGANDSNHKITRRMLILLEGEWLFNEDGLKGIRRGILERYIGDGMTDHQLALFLLNDIIGTIGR
jgi:predicted nucleotidyltransferase